MPALSIESVEKVATPADALTVFVPDSVPLEGFVPIAVVTDGDPTSQLAKLAALGLADAFDAVVISDVFGRAYRKLGVQSREDLGDALGGSLPQN